MNRSQNAKKLLAESLSALESAINVSKNTVSTANLANTPQTFPPVKEPAIDAHKMAEEIRNIEVDLEKAVNIIAKMAERHSSGDNL